MNLEQYVISLFKKRDIDAHQDLFLSVNLRDIYIGTIERFYNPNRQSIKFVQIFMEIHEDKIVLDECNMIVNSLNYRVKLPLKTAIKAAVRLITDSQLKYSSI